MELLLNLMWLLLALPAYWLWRRDRDVQSGRRFSSLQCLLALGCLLVLLFPVVSATDDLRAMRAEMEESGPTKRSAQHAGSEKTSAWSSEGQNPPAAIGTSLSFGLSSDGWHEMLSPSLSVSAAPSLLRAGRSPPISHLR
jgi:hypothetical protein